ncbi:hypothetical protein NLX83_33460 [Allokutzneria sp. A3M-2-11 16]|uniref:hypothetical protein n=1 Tax=Allokutzneria sp. A3M-2-11 16 TaxID=2962043 RepID=UPI0020B6C3FB|nr:hypothetical protein [Allokutzneria sp. A3M-2-11 16]MCP3804192.1 hypothetical protein [Allokutzneria sp. A3M-2-11 16]
MFTDLQVRLLIGKVAVIPAPAALTDALQSIQVTTSDGSRSGFRLDFAVSKRSIITSTLIPAGLFDPKTRVILVAIVKGMPQVLVDGVITRQDMNPGNDPAGSTFTVTGEDLSLLMDLTHEHSCYPGLPVQAAVMKALTKPKYLMYGIAPVAVSPVIQVTSSILNKIPIQSSTDLAYVSGLAKDVGYTFYVEPGPLPGTNVAYWGPQVRVGVPQPVLTVNSGTASNVESLSFSYDGLSKVRYTVPVTLPDTKIGFDISVPDISLLQPPLAPKPALALREKPLEETHKADFAEAAVLGLARTQNVADAISGQGKLDVLRYGHVLKARGLVSVRGAGIAYDGFYYVKSVNSEIKRGEYKQSFTLSRDGLGPLSPVVPT